MTDDSRGAGRDRISNPGDTSSNLDLSRQFLGWLQTVRHRAPATINRYMQVLVAWDKWLEGASVLTANRFQMERFQTRPRVKRGAGTRGSASTQKQEVSVLRGFYRWLVAEGILAVDPTTQLYAPTVRNVQPKAIPDHVWQGLWTPHSLGREALLVIGLGGLCGLRRRELVQLEGRHITDGMLLGFVRKGGGEHTVPWRTMIEIQVEGLPQLVGDWSPLAAAVEEAAGIDGPILPVRDYHDPYEINRLLTRIAKRRHLPHVHPHMLRHTCATNLLRCGVPIHIVSRLLNHSSMDITMRYVRASIDELQEWRHRRT